ncbi:high affinity cationic amino acid transporter 1-like isoform X2 [Linepithema humile]|uniref:high affinity cationic amino acid transporter 1-like isoform X2 n=1 Tax=Linepithema humile TaxID=83485 RepID=UPI0006238C15|nr:PREDICTED: high affinity cationic amino acid transporter 1-like isoform X2 [Linepithema humile]
MVNTFLKTIPRCDASFYEVKLIVVFSAIAVILTTRFCAQLRKSRCSDQLYNMKWKLRGLYKAFSRKKVVNFSEDSKLARVLSTIDLTALGIGSTLGVGVYVLAGNVAKTTAGPAVVISFAIAAVASMFAGLCYAEFGARVPRAGSAYIYSYVTMGEFVAFLIGWTLILEYVIGTASVVRGLSTYVDALFNNSMRNAFESAAPIDVSNLSTYPDFFAFGVTLVFSVALAFGAKESSLANNFFTLVNLSVVLFVIIGGAFKSDINNWKLEPTCTETDCPHGTGGFFPYGISGVITGAATCFYGFIGFDCVATTGEEAKNPKRSIPIAIVASLMVVFLAYFGVSAVLTTVLPYYAQNSDAPFPHMFDTIGWSWAKWLVSVGAICGLCSSLLGAMFPLPRVIYAMASDGLIFKWMGKVSSRFQTPLVGTLSAGLLTGILAAIFELSQLVNMMSIGTLLAYSIVACCVLILRYEESEAYEKKGDHDPRTFTFIVKQLVNANKLNHSTKLTAQIVTSLVFCYISLCFGVATLLSMYLEEISAGKLGYIVSLAILVVALLTTLSFIYLQPVSGKELTFSVPLVPFLPGLSVLINVYLMMMLDKMTWIRFVVWMAVGLCIYFLYGMRNSTSRQRKVPSRTTDNAKEKTEWEETDFSHVT